MREEGGAAPWTRVLHAALRRRNALEAAPFRSVVDEHCTLQRAWREADSECRVLRRRSDALAEANTLLEADLEAARGCPGARAGGASASRVRSLKDELEALKCDSDSFRRSQQKVIDRYDGDLEDARKQLAKQTDQCRRLAQEKDDLSNLLQKAQAELRSARQCIDEKEAVLEATEKEKEDLVRSTEQRLKDMYGHKMKGVLTALEAFQEEFAGGGSGGSTSNASQSSRRSSPVSTDYGEMQCQFGKLRTVVVDAWDKAGDDCRPDIEARVAGLGEALQASFERWTVSTKEDLVLYAKVLLEKERWDGGTGGSAVQRSSRGLAMVMSRLRSDAEFLYESFAPCDEAWLQYAQSAAGVVVTLATEAAAMPGRQAAAAGSVAYRLNTLGMLAAQHDAFLSELLRAWNARHPLVKGTPTLDLTAVHERCSATLRTLSQSLSTTLASLVFAHAQRPLSLLYTVDMSYYKKYKNKDAYTKANKHLKQATDTTITTVLDSLQKGRAAAWLTSEAQATSGYHCAVMRGVLRELSGALADVLLSGGDTRWFHPDQAQVLAADLEEAKRFFVASGLSPDTTSKELARTAAVVSTVMAQPTEQLITGGGLCLPFADLPEESAKGAIWCRAVVRQVLAHRKDKKAKAFTEKHGKAPKKK